MASRGLGKQQPPLWSLPVSQRPPLGLTALLTVTLPLTIGFIVVFDVGILATVLLLVLLYPLYYGSIRTRRTYRQLGKLAFGRLLVLIVNWFSPTELVLSAGRGIDQGEGWIERDSDGNLLSLKLPDKALWISNHTTLTDWIYLWILAYLSRDGDHSASLFVSLKSSLRRIPIVGSACQLFGFIFMARKWATDKEPMARQLDEIARENARVGEPMALLLFPEGTIVTANTRGISKKYAEKTQIADFKHLLLPRSTGLFFALRQLARTTPSLRLVDITVGYPLPRSSPSASASPNYASDFYTLPSVLLSHVAPPELHMHIRAFALSEIPLGDLDASDDANGEGTEDEKRAFERWLYDRWAEKDALLERFRTRGTFVVGPVGKQDERGNGSGGGAIGLTRRRRIHDDDNDDDSDDGDRRGEYRWPISLRQPSWEIPAAFQFGWPFLVAYLLWAHRRGILASIVSFLLPVFGRLAGNGQVQSSGKTDL